MTDPLYELLAPYLDGVTSPSAPIDPSSPTVTNYLSHLTTLSLSALSTTEPQSLTKSASSNLFSLQALSSRSHKSVIAASNSLSSLREYLPALNSSATRLRDGVPELDDKALSFSQKYSKANTENAVLDRRKKAMLLSRNVDKVSDILELPSLLATVIASSSSSMASSSSTSTNANYSQALDLFAHIKRLHVMHPDSSLALSVLREAEEAMKDMTSNLIISLRGQNIRLAAAIRIIGWLRRVAPELATPGLLSSPTKSVQSSYAYSSNTNDTSTSSEGSFGYLFLICRLYNLLNMLQALTPLRDLADQETQQRLQRQNTSSAQSSPPPSQISQRKPSPSIYVHHNSPFTGQQTGRYLKRYIEIFREQSFATVSMYKNVFPAASETETDPRAPPSPLSTFPAHLLALLTETLQSYLPNLTDPSARDSILMQVLYAAGSLGRLGADFSSLLTFALLDDEDEDGNDRDGDAERKEEEDEEQQVPEWIRILKKHRFQSSRLEALSSSSPEEPTTTTAGRTTTKNG